MTCTYAKGLSSEDLEALPPQHTGLTASRGAEKNHVVVGRQQQPEVFEALLRGSPELRQCISRSHVKLEPASQVDEEGCRERLRLTNLSSNLVVLQGSCPLRRNESAWLRDGQTITFTTHSHPGHVPFLTFRLVGPSDIDAGSTLLSLTAAQNLSCEGSVLSQLPSPIDAVSILNSSLYCNESLGLQSPNCEVWTNSSLYSNEGVGLLGECCGALLDTSISVRSPEAKMQAVTNSSGHSDQSLLAVELSLLRQSRCPPGNRHSRWSQALAPMRRMYRRFQRVLRGGKKRCTCCIT